MTQPPPQDRDVVVETTHAFWDPERNAWVVQKLINGQMVSERVTVTRPLAPGERLPVPPSSPLVPREERTPGAETRRLRPDEREADSSFLTDNPLPPDQIPWRQLSRALTRPPMSSSGPYVDEDDGVALDRSERAESASGEVWLDLPQVRADVDSLGYAVMPDDFDASDALAAPPPGRDEDLLGYAAREVPVAGRDVARRAARAYSRHLKTSTRRRHFMEGLSTWTTTTRAGLLTAVLCCVLVVASSVAGCALLSDLVAHLGPASPAVGATATATATCCAATATITVSSALGGSSTPVPGAPTPIPTARPGQPAATPDPHAASATVTFTQASKAVSGPASFTGCDSGCAFNDTNGERHAAQRFTEARSAGTSGGGYWAAWVHFNPNQLDCSGGCVVYTDSADGNHCINSGWTWDGTSNYYVVHAGNGGRQDVWCQTSNGRMPQGDLNFSYCLNPGSPSCAFSFVLIWNDAGYWDQWVTDADCQAATNAANNATVADANAWHPAVGHEVHRDVGGFGVGSSCSPVPGQLGTSVAETAYHDIWWRGYDDASAQAMADALLKGAVPSGWLLKAGSDAPCATPGSYVDHNDGTFAVNCQRSGTAVFDWAAKGASGAPLTADLAAALAGKGTADALATCNAYTGVAPGSCQIALSGGSLLPAGPAHVAVTVTPA